MRTKSVLRHYCDFCSKGFFKKPSAEKHEAHCTKNPRRGCGLCGNTVRDYPFIIKSIESFAHYQSRGEFENEEFSTLSEDGLRALQNQVDCCPCCTLAVLRQGKMECFSHFNYKEAFAGFVSSSQKADAMNY